MLMFYIPHDALTWSLVYRRCGAFGEGAGPAGAGGGAVQSRGGAGEGNRYRFQREQQVSADVLHRTIWTTNKRIQRRACER